jgi:hypothetical protein
MLLLPEELAPGYIPNRSGLLVPERIARRPIGGAGGFSLGFIQAGFEVIAGLDYDYHCMITYLTNMGTYPVNIHWIDSADKEKVNAKMEKDINRAAKKNGGERIWWK